MVEHLDIGLRDRIDADGGEVRVAKILDMLHAASGRAWVLDPERRKAFENVLPKDTGGVAAKKVGISHASFGTFIGSITGKTWGRDMDTESLLRDIKEAFTRYEDESNISSEDWFDMVEDAKDAIRGERWDEKVFPFNPDTRAAFLAHVGEFNSIQMPEVVGMSATQFNAYIERVTSLSYAKEGSRIMEDALLDLQDEGFFEGPPVRAEESTQNGEVGEEKVFEQARRYETPAEAYSRIRELISGGKTEGGDGKPLLPFAHVRYGQSGGAKIAMIIVEFKPSGGKDSTRKQTDIQNEYCAELLGKLSKMARGVSRKSEKALIADMREHNVGKIVVARTGTFSSIRADKVQLGAFEHPCEIVEESEIKLH